MKDVYIVGGVIVAMLLILWPMNTEPSLLSRATVAIGSVKVSVEVASTDRARTQGLSGRESLEAGEGMLFVFDTPGRYQFWMKDMHFPIDIMWISETGSIVSFAQNVPPSSYPMVYTPPADSLYVLEVPAGFVAEHRISSEDTLILPDVLQ